LKKEGMRGGKPLILTVSKKKGKGVSILWKSGDRIKGKGRKGGEGGQGDLRILQPQKKGKKKSLSLSFLQWQRKEPG